MKTIALSAFVSALAAPAVAQTGLPAEVGDGMYVTIDEIRANSIDTFQAFAGPDGGPISRSRFVSAEIPEDVLPNQPEQAMLERLFGALDANGNGAVSLSEWRNRLERDLEFADQNGDGRITLNELANARANMSFGEAVGMIF